MQMMKKKKPLKLTKNKRNPMCNASKRAKQKTTKTVGEECKDDDVNKPFEILLTRHNPLGDELINWPPHHQLHFESWKKKEKNKKKQSVRRRRREKERKLTFGLMKRTIQNRKYVTRCKRSLEVMEETHALNKYHLYYSKSDVREKTCRTR
ncbi:hypothetical protein RUM43_013399 [Polyplax serrata]|uniref:Uncharacterized protein n=1 Tax=Polyplax serrata TaxID=468196 RepID=A0AAN8NXU4_POLSC